MSASLFLLLFLGLGGPLTSIVADWWERRQEVRFKVGGES